MDEPLGRNAGNAVELAEVLELLEGNTAFAPDTFELSLELSVKLVQMCFPGRAMSDIRESILTKASNGEHNECFRKLFAAQGAKLNELDGLPDSLQKIAKKPLLATRAGRVSSWNTRSLGLGILALGGGRKKADESIDHWVGLTEIKKVGEPVEKGEPVAMVSYRDTTKLDQAMEILQASYELKDSEIKPEPLIYEWI
jgi:thymidine phosphorylase